MSNVSSERTRPTSVNVCFHSWRRSAAHITSAAKRSRRLWTKRNKPAKTPRRVRRRSRKWPAPGRVPPRTRKRWSRPAQSHVDSWLKSSSICTASKFTTLVEQQSALHSNDVLHICRMWWYLFSWGLAPCKHWPQPWMSVPNTSFVWTCVMIRSLSVYGAAHGKL